MWILIKFFLWMGVLLVLLMSFIGLCSVIIYSFPKSKLSKWICNNIITDKDLDPPI